MIDRHLRHCVATSAAHTRDRRPDRHCADPAHEARRRPDQRRPRRTCRRRRSAAALADGHLAAPARRVLDGAADRQSASRERSDSGHAAHGGRDDRQFRRHHRAGGGERASLSRHGPAAGRRRRPGARRQRTAHGRRIGRCRQPQPDSAEEPWRRRSRCLPKRSRRPERPFIVGHPGGESVELMEAARQRDMRFILMKQEIAGAMLAATWGEITGSPGVCLSTRGPGAANMVNGIAHASLDRAPLIAITDQYSRTDLRDGPAPADRPARALCAAGEVGHDHRRQDGAPAGAPRAMRDGDRHAAGSGPVRHAAERDDAGGRRPDRPSRR